MVVALAKVQTGFSGSARYWPERAGTPPTAVAGYPELSVTLLEEQHTSYYTIRRLLLSSTGLRAPSALLAHRNPAAAGPPVAPPGGIAGHAAGTATAREVVQLHYTKWPNYGVPADTEGVVQLLAAASAEQARLSPDSPIWVHCSGGVGRTGVFLSALSTIRSLAAEPRGPGAGVLPDPGPTRSPPATPAAPPPAGPATPAGTVGELVFGCGCALREQRHPWMIEGEEQYLFCHRVVWAALGRARR